MMGIFVFPIIEKFIQYHKLIKKRENDEEKRNKLMKKKMEETSVAKIKEEEEEGEAKLKENERQKMIAKIDKEEEKIENFLHVTSYDYARVMTPFEWEKSNKMYGVVMVENSKVIWI